jgi:hypothetical protein
MTGLSWTATSAVTLSGCAGWAPAERLEVLHGDGRAVVRVERIPVGPEADLDALAERHAGPAVDGCVDSGVAPSDVLGSAGGRCRTRSWTEADGTRMVAKLQYTLQLDSLVVLTTVTPADDLALVGEAAATAESARVLEPVLLTTESLPLRPARADFTHATAAWRRGESPTATEEHVITTEESFGAARHFGVTMLPGADSLHWSRMSPDERELVASVTWRSLEARGAGADTELAEALRLAASHDLVVLVTERRPGEDARPQWFAARPDRTVRVRPAGTGRTALSVHPTSHLSDLVLATHSRGATVTASAVHRRDGHVVGDEAVWSGDDEHQVVRAALARLAPTSAERSGS